MKQGTPAFAVPEPPNSDAERADAIDWIRSQPGRVRVTAGYHVSDGDPDFKHLWMRTDHLLQILIENFEPWLDNHRFESASEIFPDHPESA